MTCPSCGKAFSFVVRLNRDPTRPAATVDGAPFLCRACHTISIVTAHGTALRRPTPDEARRLAQAQAIADRMPRDGSNTVH